MFASGLVALLRYSFGSLIVVGEAVVVALLRTGGSDAANALRQMQDHPMTGVVQGVAGAALCLAAAGCVFRHTAIAAACAVAAAGCAWEWSAPLVLPLVLAGSGLAAGVAFIPSRP